MPNPTREEVAATLSAMGTYIKPESLTDEQMAPFMTETTEETVKTEQASEEQKTTEQSAELSKTETEQKTEEVVETKEVEPSPEIKALTEKYDAQLLELNKKLIAATSGDPDYKPTVPDEYSMFYDKELYDPEKGIYGGVERSEEMTPVEAIEWSDQRTAYNRAITAVNTYNEDAQNYKKAQRIAREEFSQVNPDVDPLLIEQHFQDNPLTHAQGLFLKQVHEAGGQEAYVQQRIDAAVAKIKAGETETVIQETSEIVTKDTPPLSNVDGVTNPPTDEVEIPKDMGEYFKMTPEQRALAGDEVNKMFARTEFD